MCRHNGGDKRMVSSVQIIFDGGREVNDYILDVLMILLVRHNKYQANDDNKEGCEERLQQQTNFYHYIIELCYRMKSMGDTDAADDNNTTATAAAAVTDNKTKHKK